MMRSEMWGKNPGTNRVYALKTIFEALKGPVEQTDILGEVSV